MAGPMSKKNILILTPLWTTGQPAEATAIGANAIARLLAERGDVRSILFAPASLSRPLQVLRRGRTLCVAVNRRCPRRLIKLTGWLTALACSPHLILFLNRHALTLLPVRAIAQLADASVAYIGERALSTQEVHLLKMMRRVYVEDPALEPLLPRAVVRPMGTDLQPFTLSTPSPPPPWQICFASSPLPWHEPEEIETKYLKARGVLDTLCLVEALHRYLPVHLTLVWRKDPQLVRRLAAHLPFVNIETGVIPDMNTFLARFHLYAALFRPGEELYYKPFPNSVVEAMAKGILPLAYAGTLVGELVGSVSPDLLLSPVQDLANQAEAVARRIPALFTPETRSALRQEAKRLDLRHFISHLLGEA